MLAGRDRIGCWKLDAETDIRRCQDGGWEKRMERMLDRLHAAEWFFTLILIFTFHSRDSKT